MKEEDETLASAHGRIQKALNSAWYRNAAESRPLALIIVAFDKTQTPEGVAVLERALRVHCARTHDVVLRRASDQFIAILPETAPAGARLLGERIVEAMRLEDTDHAHRVSVGVAVGVPDDHRTPEDLLRRADNALEAAHAAGGDRCLGGAATSGGAPAPAKGVFAQWRDLLPQKKDANLKRQSD